MSAPLARAMIDALDDEALDELAALLAPRLTLNVDGELSDGYLAPAAAAEYMGVSRKRLYDLKSSGALEPDGYDGRTPLFTRQTLDAYVRAATCPRPSVSGTVGGSTEWGGTAGTARPVAHNLHGGREHGAA